MISFEEILLDVQKPSRYTGGEVGSVKKDKRAVDLRFAFCFPDVYEVGMSHLGMKILYGLLNAEQDIWCERAFTPYADMREQLEALNLPLFALESRDSLADFDILGFTLQTELSYTNILLMLRMAGIPVKTAERDESHPLVIAGGPCASNPEPMADFIDLFVIGEGEEVTLELCDLYKKATADELSRKDFLIAAAKIEGIYVPSLYEVEYNTDGTIKGRRALIPGVPETVTKRIIKDLDKVFYPESFVVPFCDIVHDRIMLEVFRGCIRGCRFCQAGNLYRPVREKSVETLNRLAKKLAAATGYEEISLTSLSTSDYTQLYDLTDSLLDWCEKDMISLSLPSLRVDNFSTDLIERVQKVRKGGLTFAPEAGTQRMRDVINKNVTEEQLLKTCKIAFTGGWHAVKLYFMIGLPFETDEDVAGIAHLADKVADVYFQGLRNGEIQKGGKGNVVTVSVSSFVPKPFTPFQWAGQDTMDELRRKQKLLRESIRSRKISLSWHESKISYLEGVFARGDRRLCRVIETAFENGASFDNWEEHLKFDVWQEAFVSCGIDPAFYANRERTFDEILPWSFIDIGVSQSFLQREAEKSRTAETTPDCRTACAACGAARLNGGKCDGKA